jgi:hypothetical protein
MAAPSAWGLTYMQVVGLCWLAYAGQGTVGRWKFSDGTMWTLDEVNEPGSFRAVVVTSPRGKKILAISGTDDTFDWVDNASQRLLSLSGQYSYATATALYYQPDIVVGHSLGGGMASYVGIRLALETATVNPAPLSLPNAAPGAVLGGKVVNYVAPGEGLDLLDRYDPFSTRIGTIHYVASNGTNLVEKHLLKNLVGFQAPVRVSFYDRFK